MIEYILFIIIIFLIGELICYFNDTHSFKYINDNKSIRFEFIRTVYKTDLSTGFDNKIDYLEKIILWQK